MNTLRSARLFLAILLVGVWAVGAARVEAQLAHGSAPGYPNVGQFGSYGGVGAGSYGGLGASSYYGSGYGIGNSQVSPGYRAANRFHRQPTYSSTPLTTINYGPLYNAITALPGWYGPPARPRRRPHPTPTVARDQLLSNDGKILWPSAAPDTPARHAAEDAVRAVVQEYNDTKHASIRPVNDACNKLTAYARESLPGVKAAIAADAAGLERFIAELESALQTMALTY